MPLDYKSLKIKEAINADNLIAVLTEACQVYVWDGSKIHYSPIRLEFGDTKKVRLVLSTGSEIVVVFEDNSLSVYRPQDNHRQPLRKSSYLEYISSLFLTTSKGLKEGTNIRWSDVMKASFNDHSILFNLEQEADVKFIFATEMDARETITTLSAHSSILRIKSELFRIQLSEAWINSDEESLAKDGKQRIREIHIDEWSYEAYRSFLIFQYNGTCLTDCLNLSQTIELYQIADYYLEPYLKYLALKAFWCKLYEPISLPQLFDCYQHALAYPAILNKIAKRMGEVD